MSAPAFTPGPWAVFPYVQTPGRFTVIDGSKHKRRIALVDDSYDGISRAEAHGNAKLIAKAPEMLLLLQDCEESFTADDSYYALLQACRKLISEIEQ